MEISLFDRIGVENLSKLIHDFYVGISNDEVLRPMYKDGLEVAEKRLFLFIVQYLGGPDDYNKLRGHPRLRMRHVVFPINEEAKEHWLKNMKNALDQSDIDDPEKDFLWNYFQQTARFLKNR